MINMGPTLLLDCLLVNIESVQCPVMGWTDQKGISGMQCRMARAALGWSNKELAMRAKIGRGTVVRIEGGIGEPNPVTLAAIRTTFEEAGIEFVEDYGVLFRRGSAPSTES